MEETDQPVPVATVTAETATPSTSPSPLTSEASMKPKLRTFRFAYIKVTTEANNIVKGGQHSPTNLTRLESIDGIPCRKISVDEIRLFLKQNRNRISISQKVSKKLICDAIVEAWIRYDHDIKVLGKEPKDAGLIKFIDLTKDSKNTTTTTPPPPTTTTPKINMFRLIDVLFGDKLRPFLLERGITRSKEDLDMGGKDDTQFYQMLLQEYNESNVQEYRESFPDVHPDRFEKFSNLHHLKTHYRDLLDMYLDIQTQIDQSRTHKDGEKIAIEKFTDSVLMHYFHSHVQDEKNAGIVIGESHDDPPENKESFNESENPKPTKRAKITDEKLDTNKEYIPLDVDKELAISKTKLNASAEQLNIIRSIKESEETLSKLQERLESKIPDTGDRMRRFKEHKTRAALRHESDDDDDEESLDPYGELMNRIQYHEELLKHLQKQEKDSRMLK